MSRALRLHERHSRAELVAKVEALRNDPANQQVGELHLLTPKARCLLDDLLLAIYFKNNSLHIWLQDETLINQINDIIAEHYGATLARRKS